MRFVVIRYPDDGSLVIESDQGSVIVAANYDEDGWSGIKETVETMCRLTGVRIIEEK